MSASEPTAEPADVGFPVSGPLTPWSDAERALSDAKVYWLFTVWPDGRPHIVPVWAVWLHGALYFSTGARSRKARNIADEPRCGVSIDTGELQIAVEGSAVQVRDEATLRAVAEVYSAKYDWQMTPRDGELRSAGGEGGPVFEVRPAVVFGYQPTGDGLNATRWRFSD